MGATLALRHDTATDAAIDADAIVVYTDDPTGASGSKCILVLAATLTRRAFLR